MAKNGGSSRLRTTARDMVLSMLLIAVPILLVLWLMPSTAPKTPVSVISPSQYQAMLAAARSNLPFVALGPAGLPGGWQLTSGDYEPAGQTAADWHLGYGTPSGKYAEFEQVNETIPQYLSAQSSDATKSGTVTEDGVSWLMYSGTTPGALKTLLFRQDGSSSLEIVAGSGTLGELEALAGSLHA